MAEPVTYEEAHEELLCAQERLVRAGMHPIPSEVFSFLLTVLDRMETLEKLGRLVMPMPYAHVELRRYSGLGKDGGDADKWKVVALLDETCVTGELAYSPGAALDRVKLEKP